MNKTQRQSGSVLLITMVCIMIMAMFATMTFEPIRSETVTAGAAKDDATVGYAAEAGIEMAAADLLRAAEPPAEREFAVGKAMVRYTIARRAGKADRLLVTAVGSLPGRRDRMVTKTITAELVLHTGKDGRDIEVRWQHVRR